MRSGLMIGILALAVGLPDWAGAEESAGGYREGRERFEQGKYVEAVRAFRRAADAGDAAAIDFLGWMYLDGKGVPKSPWIAFGHFMEAAGKGNDQACRNLGNMYFDGIAVEQDAVQAAKWWEKGARGGAYRAADSLAQLLYAGDGVAVDKEKAIELWTAAARGAPPNDPRAAVALAFARIAHGEDDVAEAARKQLDALARAGNRQAADALKYLAAQKRQDVPLVEVPFVHQAYNYCGVASATMLLRFQGADASQFDVQRRCPDSRVGQGVYWSNLVIAARAFDCDWQIEQFPVTDDGFAEAKAMAITELAAGRPVILDWIETTNAHTVVLCGYDKTAREFFFRNPGLSFPGVHVLGENRLKAIWATRGFIPNNEVTRRPMIRIRAP